MTNKDQFKQLLELWNFPILKEAENSLCFRYQMNYIQLNLFESDESAGVSVLMSGVFSADDAEKMFVALRTCNELNNQLLHVKLYIDSDSDLIIAAEYFTKTSDDKEFYLDLALQAMIHAKKEFSQKYEEMEEFAKLASELENLH